MPSAYNQFRWRCIQKIIAGLAVCVAGVVLALADVEVGAVTVPGNPWLGVAIAVAGLLYAVSSAVSLRNRSGDVA